MNFYSQKRILNNKYKNYFMAWIVINEGEYIMGKKSKTTSQSGNNIKVTVHLPTKVTENIKQIKINKIYDILKPKT